MFVCELSSWTQSSITHVNLLHSQIVLRLGKVRHRTRKSVKSPTSEVIRERLKQFYITHLKIFTIACVYRPGGDIFLHIAMVGEFKCKNNWRNWGKENTNPLHQSYTTGSADKRKSKNVFKIETWNIKWTLLEPCFWSSLLAPSVFIWLFSNFKSKLKKRVS